MIGMSARIPLSVAAMVSLITAAGAQAREPAPGNAPLVSAASQAPFDVKAATEAYLARMSPEQRSRSDAYFEGGYWLQLWSFLYGAGIALLLLALRWSARMRDLSQRVTRFASVHAILYWTQYLLATTVLAFPLTVYAGFFREHEYGLATQGFGAWLGDQAKVLLVGLVLGSVLVMALFAVVRRLGRSWWLWGAGVTSIFVAFVGLVAPVFIMPLFNTYTKLSDPKLRDPILSMARANGVGANDVYEMDASRQTTRASANVSGLLGTLRITLNDNLLKRSTPAEVQAVMGHELGHYVLNHAYEEVCFFSVLCVVLFAYLRSSLDWALRRWGARWGLRGITDLAVLPLAVLLVASFSFVMTPFVNTFIRMEEHEADIFGLNASREPDGFATTMLKLGEYRKMDPGAFEEWFFYDHPSGRTRITAAMRWKAEHLR
jgi:STE24 endopeptidase